MSEWKKLEIDNLPSDILVEGNYEFCWIINGMRESPFRIGNRCVQGVINFSSMLTTLNDSSDDSLNYKKIQPKAPTHEEIMTKWWKHNGWHRVLSYYQGDYFPYIIHTLTKVEPVTNNWFIGRESADIPPEVK